MHSVNNNQGSCIQCTQSTTIEAAAFNALSQQQSRQLHSMPLSQQQSRQLHPMHSVNNNRDSCIQCTQTTTIETLSALDAAALIVVD